MKIRSGFVSNSSSTSFLILAKEDLTKANFFELMGLDISSPIASLVDEFYEDVISSISTTIDFSGGDKRPVENWFDDPKRLSTRMLEKLGEAQKSGLKAYYGWLDSDSTPIEAFFCTDSFELENERIYFNGLECVW